MSETYISTDLYHPSEFYYRESVKYFMGHCYPEEKKFFPSFFLKKSGIRRKPRGRGLKLISRRALFRKLIMRNRMKVWVKIFGMHRKANREQAL